MFRKLLDTGQIEVDGRIFVAHYFEQKTARGGRREALDLRLHVVDAHLPLDRSHVFTSLMRSCTRSVPK